MTGAGCTFFFDKLSVKDNYFQIETKRHILRAYFSNLRNFKVIFNDFFGAHFKVFMGTNFLALHKPYNH